MTWQPTCNDMTQNRLAWPTCCGSHIPQLECAVMAAWNDPVWITEELSRKHLATVTGKCMLQHTAKHYPSSSVHARACSGKYNSRYRNCQSVVTDQILCLTLPPGWAGCYACWVLRPYQFGPMRIPECNHKVIRNGYEAVNGYKAKIGMKAEN